MSDTVKRISNKQTNDTINNAVHQPSADMTIDGRKLGRCTLLDTPYVWSARKRAYMYPPLRWIISQHTREIVTCSGIATTGRDYVSIITVRRLRRRMDDGDEKEIYIRV
jgi:hypothetical protein